MGSIAYDINKLYAILDKRNLIKSIQEIEPYPDEPRMYFYATELNNLSEYNDVKTWDGKASGFSFFSRELALLKSLAEAGERLSNSAFFKSDFVFKTYSEITSQNALNPKKFLEAGQNWKWRQF